MIKTILVPTAGSPCDAAAFETAIQVARAFGARLDFLHVRVETAAVLAAASWGGSATITGDLVERWEREAVAREAAAAQAVRGVCAARGVPIGTTEAGLSAQWHREVGEEPDIVVRHGRASDLMVIARPAGQTGVALETIETALLDGGRPLLIPAAGVSDLPADTVVIAWKPSASAARAVAAALPFLLRAKHIIVQTVVEGHRPDPDDVGRLVHGLRRHGLEVTTRHIAVVNKAPAAALFEAAKLSGAGLVVMGGYGHNRLREFVFGGFTQHVLRSAELPVLMAH